MWENRRITSKRLSAELSIEFLCGPFWMGISSCRSSCNWASLCRPCRVANRLDGYMMLHVRSESARRAVSDWTRKLTVVRRLCLISPMLVLLGKRHGWVQGERGVQESLRSPPSPDAKTGQNMGSPYGAGYMLQRSNLPTTREGHSQAFCFMIHH